MVILFWKLLPPLRIFAEEPKCSGTTAKGIREVLPGVLEAVMLKRTDAPWRDRLLLLFF